MKKQELSGRVEEHKMREIHSVADYINHLDTLEETYPMQRYVVPVTFFGDSLIKIGNYHQNFIEKECLNKRVQ